MNQSNSHSPTVAVVMPTFNEAEGIEDFLKEIVLAFEGVATSLVVVDDCSTDDTRKVLSEMESAGAAIHLVTNDENRGHGPTTWSALSVGVKLDVAVVVSADGDGQIHGADLRALFDALHGAGKPYAEGVRVKRKDPWFRRMVSAFTRTLVWLKSGKSPRDANTPFRAYTRGALEHLLDLIPSDSTTPNLHISTLTRRLRWEITQIPVDSLQRRGSSPQGSTWGVGRTTAPFLPSKRFLLFCSKAAAEWFRPSRPSH